MAKHEKVCNDNQHAFIQFSFDTFGFLAPEVVDLLHRVQKVMHNNVMSPRSLNVVFTKIGFVIQRGLTAQIVAHLPSIQVCVCVCVCVYIYIYILVFPPVQRTG